MIDMSETVPVKSDQLTADDLLGGDLTITITNVSATGGEQPIAINFEGDGGKPYLPCKIMRRVLIAIWDKYADKYIGRSMTLYRDPEVKFGGMKLGGIRIRAMSHMEAAMAIALTETKAKKKVFTVKPLVLEKPKPEAAEPTFLEKLQRHLNKVPDRDAVAAVRGSKSVMAAYAKAPDDVKQALDDMFKAAFERFPESGSLDDDDFPGVVTPREAA